jgi:hypothetical protein
LKVYLVPTLHQTLRDLDFEIAIRFRSNPLDGGPVNGLSAVSEDVVEAARSVLVIGTT